MSRALLALLVLACAAGCGQVGSRASAERVVILGIDGLDPELLRGFMDEGAAPSFVRLAEQGGFIPLATSFPPQSPVAWSTFITGMDPGGHGIFDFLALDRAALAPYLSTARVEGPARAPLALGTYRVPLGAERSVSLRDGATFWEILESHGVPTTVFRMPANYPPVRTPGRALSGMGTPDLRGTPGLFSFFTDDPAIAPGPVAGGTVHRVSLRDGIARTRLEGPPNRYRAGSPPATAELELLADPEHPVAELRLGSERRLLNVGDWSDWVPVRFALVPAVGVPGMVRFYLKSLRPHLALYASPVNIDPADPAQKISEPPGYAPELAGAVGRFYTQEMPEDTKALSAHLLEPREFLAQSALVLEERRRLLRHELDRYTAEQTGGLLFFYVSSVDQRSHMLFHEMETPTAPRDLREAVRDTYADVDALVGEVLERLPEDTTLVVMSDHGFAPFRRQVHLNRWLEERGYLALRDPERRERAEWLAGIDWGRTRAFAIGLNSLYLNVRGRERHGIVPASERRALAREIAGELERWTDGPDGPPVVTHAALREDVYSGAHVSDAPDIIVGYARGYRASWATTSGGVPGVALEENDRPWSGDHCMDARAVPGVLLSNRPLVRREAALADLTVGVLSRFGIAAPPQMSGRSVF